MSKREERAAIQLVVDAALRWWSSKRPNSFNLCCHRNNPTVNALNEVERELALAVATLLDAQEDK